MTDGYELQICTRSSDQCDRCKDRTDGINSYDLSPCERYLVTERLCFKCGHHTLEQEPIVLIMLKIHENNDTKPEPVSPRLEMER